MKTCQVHVALALAALAAGTTGCAGLVARSAATGAAERWAIMETVEAAGTGVAVGVAVSEKARGTEWDPAQLFSAPSETGYPQNQMCSYPEEFH